MFSEPAPDITPGSIAHFAIWIVSMVVVSVNEMRQRRMGVKVGCLSDRISVSISTLSSICQVIGISIHNRGFALLEKQNIFL